MKRLGVLFASVWLIAGVAVGPASGTYCCVAASAECGIAACETVAGIGDCSGSKPMNCGQGYCDGDGFGCILITGVPAITPIGVVAMALALLGAGAAVMVRRRDGRLDPRRC